MNTYKILAAWGTIVEQEEVQADSHEEAIAIAVKLSGEPESYGRSLVAQLIEAN